MKKKTFATLAIVTILGLGVIGSTSAFAQTTTTGQNPMSSLVQKIATKFNLNQDDVQAVFDADRKEHHAKMQANYDAYLSQLVKDGKLTEAQKQLIVTKRAELDSARKTQFESSKNLTPEERKTQMEKEKTTLQAWAKENGIEIQYLMPHRGRGYGNFGGNPKNRPAGAPSASATPTTSQ